VRSLAQVATALVVFVGGVATGSLTVVVHETRWGIWLGIAATAASLVAVAPGRGRRLVYGLGFCGAIGYAVVRHPGGGYLIASDWRGHVLIGFAYVVVAFCFATVPRRVRRVETDPGT
jgi:hypothetical protein